MKSKYVNFSTEEIAIVEWLQSNDDDKIVIYISTDDVETEPHFHVRKYRSDGLLRWVVGIKFDSAEYIFHEGCTDKLPDSSISKQINELLKPKCKYCRNKLTTWEFAILCWNSNNLTNELDINILQPDYSKLK